MKSLRVIKKIGKVLEGLKEKLEKPKEECKPDTRGWDNIV